VGLLLVYRRALGARAKTGPYHYRPRPPQGAPNRLAAPATGAGRRDGDASRLVPRARAVK